MANPVKGGGVLPDLWKIVRHDFRQVPQTLAILTHGLAEAGSDHERFKFSNAIRQVAASLREMERGVTMISQLEAGELPVATEPQALAGGIEAELAEIADLVRSVGGRIVPERLEGSALVDRELLARMVRGMLLLAVKFASDGGVAIGASVAGKSARVVVSFAGVLPQTALEEMAFVELAPTDATGGEPVVGLGPALVARVANWAGGGLALEVGATGQAMVILSLPADAAR